MTDTCFGMSIYLQRLGLQDILLIITSYLCSWGMDTNSNVQSPGAVREEDSISQLSGEIGVKKQGEACRKLTTNPSLLIQPCLVHNCVTEK